MLKVKVENMISPRSGRPVANQFEIWTNEGIYFQSYNIVIAFKGFANGKRIRILDDDWDYSRTTGKYRNQFLGETKKETQKKIDSGEYLVQPLN